MSELPANPQPQVLSRDARLAAELVANLRPREEVAAAYGYTVAQMGQKLRNPEFRKIIRETREAWSADKNVKERVRIKAGLLVEDSLLDVFAIVSDHTASHVARTNAFSQLTKVASMDSPDKGADGSGFKVIINLPNQAPVQIAGPVYEHDEEGTNE
jgi:hypothetical protein